MIAVDPRAALLHAHDPAADDWAVRHTTPDRTRHLAADPAHIHTAARALADQGGCLVDVLRRTDSQWRTVATYTASGITP